MAQEKKKDGARFINVCQNGTPHHTQKVEHGQAKDSSPGSKGPAIITRVSITRCQSAGAGYMPANSRCRADSSRTRPPSCCFFKGPDRGLSGLDSI